MVSSEVFRGRYPQGLRAARAGPAGRGRWSTRSACTRRTTRFLQGAPHHGAGAEHLVPARSTATRRRTCPTSSRPRPATSARPRSGSSGRPDTLRTSRYRWSGGLPRDVFSGYRRAKPQVPPRWDTLDLKPWPSCMSPHRRRRFRRQPPTFTTRAPHRSRSRGLSNKTASLIHFCSLECCRTCISRGCCFFSTESKFRGIRKVCSMIMSVDGLNRLLAERSTRGCCTGRRRGTPRPGRIPASPRESRGPSFGMVTLGGVI